MSNDTSDGLRAIIDNQMVLTGIIQGLVAKLEDLVAEREMLYDFVQKNADYVTEVSDTQKSLNEGVLHQAHNSIRLLDTMSSSKYPKLSVAQEYMTNYLIDQFNKHSSLPYDKIEETLLEVNDQFVRRANMKLSEVDDVQSRFQIFLDALYVYQERFNFPNHVFVSALHYYLAYMSLTQAIPTTELIFYPKIVELTETLSKSK